MQSATRDLSTSCSEGGFRREQGDVTQHQNEMGIGSRTGGSPSHGNDGDDDDDDGDDGKEREDNYGAGDLYGDDDYYGYDPYGNYGDEPYGNYYGDGGDDYW